MGLIVIRLAVGLVASALATSIASSAPARDASPYAATLRQEAEKAGLPYPIADAVMAIESGYDPGRIGGVGEIGLMQVRPGTAAMLGFKGTDAELAAPATNIHYGVTYLAGAWHQAGGDLCRALMKYRAGHGEEVMTPLSVTYCERARAHLAGLGSSFAQGPLPAANLATGARPVGRNPLIGMSSAAFWAAQRVRIARINARIERRWAVASR